MFSSRKFFKSVDEIPDAWIFKYYLGLAEDFTGKSIRVRSIFNKNDKTPSMFVYLNKELNKIVYKCHSTGKAGNSITLVQELYDLPFHDACEKIIKDYYDFCKTGEYKPQVITVSNIKWTVTDYTVRSWCVHDAEFWLQFNIGSSILSTYRVFPLSYYKVAQVNCSTGEIIEAREHTGRHMYGYFVGEKLYKLYNPMNKRFKFFLEDGSYTQGFEQLEGHDTLVIASSLKDVMAIKSLGLTIDCIAPNSESTKLTTAQIESYKDMYKHVIVCLDSDEAGINSMKYYKEKYNLPFIYLPREKDISDIIKHHGKDAALYDFYPKLQSAIEKYVKKNS